MNIHYPILFFACCVTAIGGVPPIVLFPRLPHDPPPVRETWSSNMWGNAVGTLNLQAPLIPGVTAYSVTCWMSQGHKADGDHFTQGYGNLVPHSFYTFDPCERAKTAFLSETGQGPRVYQDALPPARDWSADPAGRTVFSNGVFAVAFTSDAPATLSMAGRVFTNGVSGNVCVERRPPPGWRDIGVQCGPDAAWSLNVAHCPVVRFYGRHEGEFDTGAGLMGEFRKESIVTNEMVFVAMQVRLDGTGHRYRGNFLHWEGGWEPGDTDTWDAPPVVNVTTGTIFRVQTIGMAPPASNTVWRVWNVRVRPFWLADGDIGLIRDREAEAMGRLGIPRWHTGE